MSEEKKIRALLYVTPKFKWKYLVNWLITIWTWCRYSHCELWVGDESKPHYKFGGHCNLTQSYGNMRINYPFTGTCYSSTLRGKSNGTVKRPASKVLDHPENWVYIEAEMEIANYDAMIRFLENEVRLNKGYSKRDLLKFLSPIHFPDNKRNICSEITNNALCVGLLLRGFGIISPKKLYKKLIAAGCKPKEL